MAVVPIDVFKDAAAKACCALGLRRRYCPRRLWRHRSRRRAKTRHLDAGRLQERALLAAPSIAFLPASAAGAYVTKVFERLGIAEEMKARTKVQAAPTQIAPRCRQGRGGACVFLMNVLRRAGRRTRRPVPGELQQELVFTSAVADARRSTPPRH